MGGELNYGQPYGSLNVARSEDHSSFERLARMRQLLHMQQIILNLLRYYNLWDCSVRRFLYHRAAVKGALHPHTIITSKQCIHLVCSGRLYTCTSQSNLLPAHEQRKLKHAHLQWKLHMCIALQITKSFSVLRAYGVDVLITIHVRTSNCAVEV